MTELIGWIGANLLAFCGLPQCIQVVRVGNVKGLSKAFTWMWISGEVFTQTYVLLKHGLDLPLLWNYWINTLFVLIILYYIYFPRKTKDNSQL